MATDTNLFAVTHWARKAGLIAVRLLGAALISSTFTVIIARDLHYPEFAGGLVGSPAGIYAASSPSTVRQEA